MTTAGRNDYNKPVRLRLAAGAVVMIVEPPVVVVVVEVATVVAIVVAVVARLVSPPPVEMPPPTPLPLLSSQGGLPCPIWWIFSDKPCNFSTKPCRGCSWESCDGCCCCCCWVTITSVEAWWTTGAHTVFEADAATFLMVCSLPREVTWHNPDTQHLMAWFPK